MDQFERGLLHWCREQRGFVQKCLDSLQRGWKLRGQDGEDATEDFKKSITEKIEELE
jgi:hypothetical protein